MKLEVLIGSELLSLFDSVRVAICKPCFVSKGYLRCLRGKALVLEVSFGVLFFSV